MGVLDRRECVQKVSKIWNSIDTHRCDDLPFHEKSHGGVHTIDVSLQREFQIVLCFLPLIVPTSGSIYNNIHFRFILTDSRRSFTALVVVTSAAMLRGP